MDKIKQILEILQSLESEYTVTQEGVEIAESIVRMLSDLGEHIYGGNDDG